jgi:hypothetical protein
MAAEPKKTLGRPKKISLNADEICKIIAECGAANVAEIDFQGLHIVFNARRNEQEQTLGQEVVLDKPQIPTEEFNDKEARLMNEQALLDAEDAQILIDDPLAFEKMNTSIDIERSRVLNS